MDILKSTTLNSFKKISTISVIFDFCYRVLEFFMAHCWELCHILCFFVDFCAPVRMDWTFSLPFSSYCSIWLFLFSETSAWSSAIRVVNLGIDSKVRSLRRSGLGWTGTGAWPSGKMNAAKAVVAHELLTVGVWSLYSWWTLRPLEHHLTFLWFHLDICM